MNTKTKKVRSALTEIIEELEIVKRDPYLQPHSFFLHDIQRRVIETEKRLTGEKISLLDFASAHEYFGLHFDQQDRKWTFREWAPNASAVYLIGDCSRWKKSKEYKLESLSDGVWEIVLPEDTFKHKDLYNLCIEWPGGEGERIPAYVRRTVQDPKTKLFAAQVWEPTRPYKWKTTDFKFSQDQPLLIYEAHVGMAQEEEKIGTFEEFRKNILPRIAAAGYNAVQFMGIQEHPYYGSFGYQVSSFYAPSSRFGTPDDLKKLIDSAHQAGLAVLIDLVHSHAVKNEIEGLSRFDGTLHQYFHDGPRGEHPVWDSRLFNYGKTEVLHFLLSNVRYWLDAFQFDGFRFDGVTSMLYHDHGLGEPFSSYDKYFGDNLDTDALIYLALANHLAHQLRPEAITIAEDVSGLPGLGASFEEGGTGFDYRLSMGVPDFWKKTITEKQDEEWHVEEMFHKLTNRRGDEKVISYAESHDQALVGDKTIIFRFLDSVMYDSMRFDQKNYLVDRGVALHRLIGLITMATAGHGYLNFMGNEFGHPEWIDFPRDGNNWSCKFARRQWSLRDNPRLQYFKLAEFDQAMINLALVL